MSLCAAMSRQREGFATTPEDQFSKAAVDLENPIDDCWRCDPIWENNRQSLADCALGFGSKAIGGQGGQIYIVTDNSDNDTVNPAPGTLRYGVAQAEPL